MITSIKKLLKKTHHSIPLKVRQIYLPVLIRCVYFYQNHLNAIFPPVILYEGLEHQTGKPFLFAYAGDIHQMHNYWDHVILQDGFQKRNLGRRFFGNVIPELKKLVPSCSLLIMEQSFLTASYLDKKPGFPIPLWIRMEIDIRRPVDDLFEPERRTDIKRCIRKHHLSYAMSKDRRHFEDFYHTMYLPYIKKRYADAATGITPYESFLKTIPVSEMLLIKAGDQIIAGASIEFIKGRPFLRRLGIVDANEEYMRTGAIGAIYYFLIQELKVRGYRLIDVGGTRPLLSDGLTRYKLSLGARLCKENSKHTCVRLMILHDSPGVRSFLTNNPFLFKDPRKNLCQALFVETNGGMSAKAINGAVQSSTCEGTKETHIYAFGDKNLPEELNAASQKISVHRAEELIEQA